MLHFVTALRSAMPEDPVSATPEAAPAAAEPETKDGKRDWRSLRGLLIVQSQNVLNDKITQFILIGLAGVVAANMAVKTGWGYGILNNYDLFIAVPMSLPFVLLAPLAGWLSDRFSKRSVIVWCMILQVSVLAWIAFGLYVQEIWLTSIGFLLLAIQSTLLSPAKMGICKEFVGSQKLAVAAGWMQMLTIVCIILGSVIGGQVFAMLAGGELPTKGDVSAEKINLAWNAALWIVLTLMAFSFIPFLVLLSVNKPPAHIKQPFRAKLLFEHFRHLGEVLKHRQLKLATVGDMFFWFAGGSVALILIQAGKEVYPNGEANAIMVSGYFNGALGVGVALGSVLVSIISRNRNELGLVPLGALGMALTLTLVFFQAPNTVWYFIWLVGLGLSSAAFMVPLNALIQDLPSAEKRGRVLSSVNLLNSMASLGAIGFVLVLRMSGLSTSWQFLILAGLSLGAAIYILQLMPRHWLQFILLGLTKLVYKIKPLNSDRVPKEGGVLMISNHVSYIDAFIISAACPRPVRFVVFSQYMQVKPIAWFLRLFNVVPISPTRAKDAIRVAADAVANGDIVCIFPEGELTRTGMMNELKKGFELIARKAKSPVLPVYMDALWGSIFSFERRRFFYKVPRRFPYPVSVIFGEPIPHDEINVDRARAALQDLSADSFANRADIDRPLGAELVRALKRRPGKAAMVDLGKRRRVLKRGIVLANAAGLARVWRKHWPENRERIGVLLPPGSMAAIINLAAVLAGRTPVNLPIELMADDDLRQQLLDEHGIDCVITSVALFPGRELPNGHFDMTAEMLQISAARRVFERIAARIELSWFASRRLRVRHGNPDAEAFAYFTKSEANDYKFVSLTHRNVLASVYQIDSSLLFQPRDEIFLESGFDELPAALLGLWHPILKRGTAVYRGLAARQTPASLIISDQSPELVLLTPGMAKELTVSREVPPGVTRAFLDFSAEPLEKSAIEMLEERGADYCRGFYVGQFGGLVAISTIDPNYMMTDGDPQAGKKSGSIGRLLPGVSGRIVDDEDQMIGLGEVGRLFVRGGGFAEDLETRNFEGKAWIDTGLRGRFDRDGFFVKAE